MKTHWVLLLILVILLGTTGANISSFVYPKPETLTPVWQNKSVEINGISTKVDYYISPTQPEETMAILHKLLLDNGWSFVKQMPELSMNLYSKNDFFLYVSVAGGYGGLPTSVYICKSPEKLVVCIPSQQTEWVYGDMRGHDINEIPRYPGSLRKLSIISTNEFFLIYQTGDKPEKVAEFYKQRLTASGWKVLSELRNPQNLLKNLPLGTTNTSFYSLIFQRNSDMLNLLITYTEPLKTTIINITKNVQTAMFKNM